LQQARGFVSRTLAEATRREMGVMEELDFAAGKK